MTLRQPGAGVSVRLLEILRSCLSEEANVLESRGVLSRSGSSPAKYRSC